MKALIMAAGVGKRLAPLTDHTPKCLVELRDTTLLERMLSCLRKSGIDKAYIVVGHFKEKIIRKIGNNFNGLPIEYVENPRFKEGSILSIWFAREFLKDDDFLIMDADVLFPLQMLQRLVNSSHKNCFLLDDRFQDSGEEMKLGVRQGRVLEIARKMSEKYDKVGEGVGFLKISREDLPSFLVKLDSFYGQNRTGCEYEDAMNEWIKEVPAGCESAGDFPWTEMDFIEDAKKAWLHVFPKIEELESSVLYLPVNRRLSRYFTRYFLKTSLTPNQITGLSFLSGMIGLGFFTDNRYLFQILGALFFQLFYILDNCDGEVARAKNMTSRWGSWLDIGCDAVIHILFFMAVSWGVYSENLNKLYLYLGLFSSLGVMIIFSIFMYKRALTNSQNTTVFLKLPPKRYSILEFLKSGDFSVIVFIFTLLNILPAFLWMSVVGLQVFWICILLFSLKENPVI